MQFTTQKSSRLGIGIDFGTSNSAAAVFDGEHVTLIKLAAPDSVMPSANYIDRAYQSSIGQLAIDDYISGNIGRKVELSVELLGEARSGTGGGESAMGGSGEGDTSNVYGQAFDDSGLPGRLFRGTKRLLGNTTIDRTAVFEKAFRLVALVVPILVGIRRSIEKTTGSKVEHASLGHPVNFEGIQSGRNSIALERLADALGRRHAPRKVAHDEEHASR